MRKLKQNKFRRPLRRNSFDYINEAFFFLFCISVIFPVWDMIMRSLAMPDQATSLSIVLFPSQPTLSAYRYVFASSKIINAFFVSVARTVIGTLLALLVTMCAAFPLSKPDLPGRNFFTAMFLIVMFFSGGLIPTYLLNRRLGLVDSLAVYILPTLVNSYHIILARNYLMSLDKGMEESALIDGANYFQILVRIIMPVTKPLMATLGLWIAVAHWNAWFDALIYSHSGRIDVLQLILYRMRWMAEGTRNDKIADIMRGDPSLNIVSQTIQMATTVVIMFPIICVYPFIQKYFVKGIMVGSLKG